MLWGLAELGLPFERLDYGHVYGGLDSPEFRALNPHRRVPVLRDGGLGNWESCAILRYLGAHYGSAPFWPEDAAARAGVDMWAEWGKISFCADFTAPIFWLRVRTAAKDRDEAALSRGLAVFDKRLAVLEAQLAGRQFVTGDDFTLADIVIGHVLYRYFEMDIARRDRPLIAEYYELLSARPAYREHVMVSYAPLHAEGA